MKRIFPLYLILIFTLACSISGIETRVPIPTLDVNEIPTMVVQTAQALAALTDAQAAAFPMATAAPTQTATATMEAPTSTPTLLPSIGDAIIMMVFSTVTPSIPTFAEATPDFFLAELIPPTPTKQGCPVENSSRETQMVGLINAERVKAGLAEMVIQEQLITAARMHSSDMACNNYFAHYAPDGSHGGDRLLRVGYIWKYFGENIAAGFSDPQKAVQAWMNSPSHKANILNTHYTEVGAGYAYYPNSSYGVYWTIMFGAQ